MIPGIDNQKTDGNLGVSVATDRILAIVAPCEKGPSNTPTSCSNPDDAFAQFGEGPLTAAATYIINTSQKPVVLVRGAASTVGAYGAIDSTGKLGTSVVTAGSPVPLDTYDVQLKVSKGGVIATAGIELQYSLDGGLSFSAAQSLGTANTYTIPGTGVGFAFAAGTLLLGDIVKVSTTAPQMTTADIAAALTALYTYDGEWLRLFVDARADATILAQLDAYVKTFWSMGKNPEAITNLRFRNSGETRAAYQAALAAVVGTVQSTEVSPVADQCEIVIRGRRGRRPAALAYAARLMQISDEIDPAQVSLGALTGTFVVDASGSDVYHDELKYPGLDALGITTLRTFRGRPKRPGVYVNNARLLAGATSDYQYFQHTAVINRLIEKTYSLLEARLSGGVPLAQGGTIAEDSAVAIEEAINAELRLEFVEGGKVSDQRFRLSRTDNLASNGGKIGFKNEAIPLGYLKNFVGKTGFVKAIVKN